MKTKGYSALNILGLSMGMAVAILIGLWVNYEYTYDKFLPEYNNLYQVKRNFNSNGEFLTFNATSLKLGDVLRDQIPEIEYVAESDWMSYHGLKVGEKKFFMEGAMIGGDFLKMFRYPLLYGNPNTVLKDPYSIVLTESTAKTLFGNENPLYKTIRFENKNDLKVTGILKDLPGNSSLQFKYLVPFSYFEQTEIYVKEARKGSFGNNSFQHFVKLKDGASYKKVSAKIKDIEKIEKDNNNAMLSDVILQPLENWHLFSEYKNGKEVGGFIEYIRIFSIIGVLVLVIACINFINLTTARSEKRAKEVGVRKAIGSHRKDLILQFLVESFAFTVIAGICALLFVQLSLPFFNVLAGTKISISFGSGSFWLTFTAGLLATALLAGCRPAFYLSSFEAVKVLKGTIGIGKTASLSRKALVVIQFTCSIALIISTIIIYQQIQYAKDRPTGYKLNRLLMTDMNNDLVRNYSALKNELLQKGVIESMTTASSPATGIYSHGDIDQWPGKNAGETVEMGFLAVSEDYFETLGITFKEGRDFTGQHDTLSGIFNETAIKQLRIKSPLNQVIRWNERNMQIVGITKDALMISPFAHADPTLFVMGMNNRNVAMYRLSPNIKTEDAIAQLTAIFNKYSPSYPYIYNFADQEYATKFKLELLIGRLSLIFSILAIIISCLGLFGLAAYIAEQRTKEIGIRKVLGATISQIWIMLSKDFIYLVLISFIIAAPIAIYFVQNWLEKYSYRVSIQGGVIVCSAAIAIIITLITTSFQAIKAALMNPVKSLRSE